MNDKKTSFYIFLVLLFIASLATGGIFVKLSELGPVNTGLYRVLISLFLLFPILKFENKKGRNTKLNNKDKFIMFIAGCFLAGDLILWNISFDYTTVANANLLGNLVPFTIIPISYFVYKEKVSRNFLLSLLIVLIGLVVLMKGKVSPSPDNFYGDFLAFITSIFYALFLLIVYKVRKKASAVQITYFSGFGAIFVLFLGSLIMEGIQFPTSFSAFLPLLALAIFSQILGQGGLSYILGKISANVSSVLLLTQPVISAIYSYFIFGETLSFVEILGVFIILFGIFLVKKS